MRRALNKNHYFILGFLFGLIISFYVPGDVWYVAQDVAGNCPISVGTIEDERFGVGFESHLNLVNKPLEAKKRVKTVIRPRYYSSELGIREKLFIGVITSQSNISSYATAINKTAAHLVNKIKFFINADNVRTNFRLRNIVGFTDTREKLRPFHILKYIADNYVDDFDYFLIIPDQVYVNAKSLRDLVNHISVTFDIYMGRKIQYDINNSINNLSKNNRIRGTRDTDENNLSFDLDNDHDFCDLNAGILLSSSVIRQMRTNLDWCVRNAVTNKHSINIGRCVKYSTKIRGCQEKFQGIEIKSFEFDNVKLFKDLKLLQKDEEFKNSITIFPLTSPDEFYILHSYFSRLQLENLKNRGSDLVDKSYHIANGTIPNEILDIRWPLGTVPVSMPETRHDIIQWQFLNRTHIFMPNHEISVEPLKKIDLKDLNKILNITISYIKNKYHAPNVGLNLNDKEKQQQQINTQHQLQLDSNNDIKFENIHTVYRRFDPMRGMDYHVHFDIWNSKINQRELKSFHLVKPLGRVEIIPSPYVTESTNIAILLPTFEHQIENLETFIKSYEKICMENLDNTFLMLVLLYNYDSSSKDNSDPFQNVKQTAINLSNKFKSEGSRIAWVSIRLPPDVSEQLKNNNYIRFSSIYATYEILSLAVTDLSLPKIGLDRLILLGSNAMTFKFDFLNRVRMNTIEGFQIFSPIAYMMYPCTEFKFCKECDTCDVSQSNGYFDKQNFDVISFYSRDYVEGKLLQSFAC